MDEPLRRRLQAVAPMVVDDLSPVDPGAVRLERIVESVAQSADVSRVWLLLTAVAGTFPTPEEVQAGRRRMELESAAAVAGWLLDVARQSSGRDADVDLVVDGVLADCDYSATHNQHTGIQRVVRSTVPYWLATRDLTPVAWTRGHTAFRPIEPVEMTRLTRWTGSAAAPPEGATHDATSITVPWRSSVVLMDMPAAASHSRLAALAQYSGNRVVAVGYDCIPVVSGDMVPPALPETFVHYLAVIKHSDRVAGISESATVEFQGFSSMVRSQGLRGPDVVECALPVDAALVPSGPPRSPSPARPVVVCVGSFEPRKNQLAVMAACEQVWASGVDFELRFIAPAGWRRDVKEEIRRLRAEGRPVSVHSAVSEEELARTYAAARCTMFVSLHEGYGLPVAESLAHGVPVITTNYGSTAQIAAGGGCVLVDPRDEVDIAAALRRILTDRAYADALRREIGLRHDRRWRDYADELWDCLVASGDVEGRVRG